MFDYQLEIELKRQIFEESYFEFFKWSFEKLFPNEKYEDAEHIEFLCNLYQKEVERIIRKEEKEEDIIVNIPPRTSKSLITNVSLLPWMWIKDPTLPMISISFDEDLILLNAQYSKDIINTQEYQMMFGDRFKIRREYDSKGFFMNDKGGFKMSKTTGSNITGHKGVVIVVDDPQNPKTSESEVFRKQVTEYYTKSLYNRLTPINLGVRIIIMQRLHEDDLTGYLLKNNPENYRHICLPATLSQKVQPTSFVEKYKNGLLDPIRLSQKTLLGFKKTLGSRGYSGQYDQNPAPDDGGIIKPEWFDIVRPETLTRDINQDPIHFFIDSAYTEKTENDPTAILVCYRSGNFIYILDVVEVWMEFPQLIQFLIQYVQKFQYHPQNSKIFIEPKASGKSIAQQLRMVTMLNVVEMKPPENDKTTRAHSITPTLESRRVKLVEGSYITKFVEQLRLFPNASHDDMVDDLVNCVNELLIVNGPDFIFL